MQVACYFFFNDTATTEIYTLSLHDALPIFYFPSRSLCRNWIIGYALGARSEEHTSELQSHHDLVCRLLLEKKKKIEQKYKNITAMYVTQKVKLEMQKI